MTMTLSTFLIAAALIAMPTSALAQATVNGLDPRPPDRCKAIVRHDDMANCYFAAKNWTKVIWAYKSTPRGSLTYPSDDAQNSASVREFYQQAVAYHNLGNDAEADTSIFLAYDTLHSAPNLSKFMRSQIKADYAAWATSTSKQLLNSMRSRSAADSAWARDQGMSAEEVHLVSYHGRPCHIESYEGSSGYNAVTFWFCDADGHYEEAYTFTNGHQTSHYVP
jgi:hypothetical protein